MTAATLPAWGLADWTDYLNNWTEGDAEYLQKRSVVRYETTGARDGGIGSEVGAVTYINDGTYGRLQMCGKTGTYRDLLAPINLSLSDTASVVGLSLTGGSAVVQVKASSVELGPSQALIVNSTGVSIKTGANTVVLTTDGTQLVSDTALSVPSLASSGAITGTSFTGSVAATTVTASSSITVGAITLTNATGAIAATTVAASSTITATTSVTGGTAKLATTSSTAELSSTTGGHGAYVRLTADALVKGTVARLHGDTRYINNAAGSLTDTKIAGIVVAASGAGLVATNYPEGTIWVKT